MLIKEVRFNELMAISNYVVILFEYGMKVKKSKIPLVKF